MTVDRDYLWLEQAALLPNGKMVRGKFVRADDHDALNSWRNQFKNTNTFSSIAFYAEASYESVFIAPIHFDIDSKDDLSGARESALILCEMLMDRIEIPQDCLDIFFSGNKGFHIMVPCEVFSAFYSPKVLGLYRRMAQKAGEAGVRFLDTGIYTKKRIWRMSNSRHSKSRLFKIPLRYEELRDVGMAGILKLAEEPRPDDTYAMPVMCEKAVQWFRRAIDYVETHATQKHPDKSNVKFKRGWRMPPCVKAIQDVVLPDGIRHQTYISLARFCSWIGMHPDEILERIEKINDRNPIRDTDSIQRAVKFGAEHPGFPGCDDPPLKRYCRPDTCFYAKMKASTVRESGEEKSDDES